MAENIRESNPTPQFELPQTPTGGQEALTERAIEQKPAGEPAAGKKAPKALTPPPAEPPAVTVVTATDKQDPASAGQGQISGDMKAEDTDLIEKQWVDRAKAIVAHTQDDPHKQKDEMSRFKAEYVKKRFNKTVPVDDTVTP